MGNGLAGAWDARQGIGSWVTRPRGSPMVQAAPEPVKRWTEAEMAWPGTWRQRPRGRGLSGRVLRRPRCQRGAAS